MALQSRERIAVDGWLHEEREKTFSQGEYPCFFSHGGSRLHVRSRCNYLCSSPPLSDAAPRTRGISLSDISIWIERVTIHIRLLVGWNEPPGNLLYSLAQLVSGNSGPPLQTLTHITACFGARKTTRDPPRRLSRLLFILLLKLFFCPICIPFSIGFRASCLERRSSPDDFFSSTISRIFTAEWLSSERPPEIDFFRF